MIPGGTAARSRIFESSEILIFQIFIIMKIQTKTLTLESGCPPRVMGVFEGSIVLFVVFSRDLPKKFFQLDGTIMTC